MALLRLEQPVQCVSRTPGTLSAQDTLGLLGSDRVLLIPLGLSLQRG